MKKYKIIGLGLLMTLFIVINFVIGAGFNKEANPSILSVLQVNQANAEDPYGNGKYGYCWSCIKNGVVGVEIVCNIVPTFYCIDTACTGGFC
jgi:hypothetical protein